MQKFYQYLARIIVKRAFDINKLEKSSNQEKEIEFLRYYRSLSKDELELKRISCESMENFYKNFQYGIIFMFIFSVITILIKSSVDNNNFSTIAIICLYFAPLLVVLIFISRLSFKQMIVSMRLGMIKLVLEEQKKENEINMNKIV